MQLQFLAMTMEGPQNVVYNDTTTLTTCRSIFILERQELAVHTNAQGRECQEDHDVGPTSGFNDPAVVQKSILNFKEDELGKGMWKTMTILHSHITYKTHSSSAV